MPAEPSAFPINLAICDSFAGMPPAKCLALQTPKRSLRYLRADGGNTRAQLEPPRAEVPARGRVLRECSSDPD